MGIGILPQDVLGLILLFLVAICVVLRFGKFAGE